MKNDTVWRVVQLLFDFQLSAGVAKSLEHLNQENDRIKEREALLKKLDKILEAIGVLWNDFGEKQKGDVSSILSHILENFLTDEEINKLKNRTTLLKIMLNK